MPLEVDPFSVPVEEKAAKLLAINAAALKAGADYCNAMLWMVREEKLFVSSRGSRIRQSRVRVFPQFSVTVIDKQSGRFAERESMLPPRAAGWEYMSAYDGEAEAASLRLRPARSCSKARRAHYDVVVDAANLWLTIHETVGHSTELDRALGWEADFAGTSFVTPEKLGTLQFGSPLMTVLATARRRGGSLLSLTMMMAFAPRALSFRSSRTAYSGTIRWRWGRLNWSGEHDPMGAPMPMLPRRFRSSACPTSPCSLTRKKHRRRISSPASTAASSSRAQAAGASTSNAIISSLAGKSSRKSRRANSGPCCEMSPIRGGRWRSGTASTGSAANRPMSLAGRSPAARRSPCSLRRSRMVRCLHVSGA